MLDFQRFPARPIEARRRRPRTPQELSVESPPNHFPPRRADSLWTPNKEDSPRAGGEGKSGPNKGPNKKDSPLAPQPMLWAHSTPRRTPHGAPPPSSHPSWSQLSPSSTGAERSEGHPRRTRLPRSVGVLARSLPAPLARSRRRDRGSSCMTASTDWPRIGPAAYRAATR